MQSLHVRFIFQLSIPLHGDFRGGYSFNLASTGIGLTLKTQNSEDNWYYQIQLLSCDSGLELDATKCLTWAKRNPYILQTKSNTTIEGLVLRLKIKHGIFDFRKVKKRAIRFNVNCFCSGTFISRGTSEIYQLLPKKRKADDSEINEEGNFYCATLNNYFRAWISTQIFFLPRILSTSFNTVLIMP
jgi:hypothetical protein